MLFYTEAFKPLKDFLHATELNSIKCIFPEHRRSKTTRQLRRQSHGMVEKNSTNATVTASLTIHDASEAIEFYKKAFDATESYRLATPDGTILYAEIVIGNSAIMLFDDFPERESLSPHCGGSPNFLKLTVPDVDATFAKALTAGAIAIQSVMDHYWGERTGLLFDPFGHRWSIASRTENVPPHEISQRMFKHIHLQSLE